MDYQNKPNIASPEKVIPSKQSPNRQLEPC